MPATKRDLDLVLAELDKQPPVAMVGLFSPSATARAAVLGDLLSPPPSARVRTPGHRKIISTRLDATSLPTYVLPWQHLIFRVLDALHEPALPNDRQTINNLRTDLLRITRLDAHEAGYAQSALDFARKFRSNFRPLVLNVATLANAVFVVTLENLDKIAPDQAAEVLEAARYFLSAPGAVVVLSADEARFADHLSHGASGADGRGVLRAWMTGKLEVGAASAPGVSQLPVQQPPRPGPTLASPAPRPAPTMDGTPPAARPVIAPVEAVVSSPAPTRAVAALPTLAAPSPGPAHMTERMTVNTPASTGAPTERLRGDALRPVLACAAAALGMFALDSIAKSLAGSALGPLPPPRSINVLGDVLRLEWINAAPATFLGGVLAALLEMTGIGLTLLLVAFGDEARRSLSTLVGYGLIVGALAANLGERAVSGGLTNFIHITGLPVFNAAHLGLLMGALLVLASLARKSEDEDAPPRTA